MSMEALCAVLDRETQMLAYELTESKRSKALEIQRE